MTKSPVVANVCFPGYQSGRHIAWDTGKLSILAFELQAANGGDHGDISIGVAHPDNLQEHAVLHIETDMEPAQEDLTLYNGDNMRDSVVHSRLVSLSWAPIGSPSTLLSATRRGNIHVWSMAPPSLSAGCPLTVDEWYGEVPVRLKPLVAAVWLAPPPLWHWEAAAAGAAAVPLPGNAATNALSLESHFDTEAWQASSAAPNAAAKRYWVRAGSLVMAAVTVEGELTVAWRELNCGSDRRWQQSAATPLLACDSSIGRSGLTCADVVTTTDGDLHVLLASDVENWMVVVLVTGDPTAPSTSGAPINLTAVLATDIEHPAGTVLLSVHLQSTAAGTTIEATYWDPTTASIQFRRYHQPPPAAAPAATASWSGIQASVRHGAGSPLPPVSMSACVNGTFSVRNFRFEDEQQSTSYISCTSTRGGPALPLSQRIDLSEGAIAVTVCPTGSCIASLHREGRSGSTGGRLCITPCLTAAASLAPPLVTFHPEPALEQERSQHLLSYRLAQGLAWSMVSGCSGWGAEAAARALSVPHRQQVFGHLDGWLHGGSHFIRPHYALLLTRLKLRILCSAVDASGVRLAADLFASVAWDAAGSAVQAIVPSGDTNSILKAVLKEENGQQRSQMEQLLMWMNWTNAFVDYFLSSLRRWAQLVAAAEGLPSTAEAAQAALAAAALPGVRLAADAAFLNRALHTQSRLVVAAACLIPQSQKPASAAVLMNDPLAKRTQEQWSSLHALTDMLKKQAPSPTPSEELGAASAACASAAASFQGADPVHLARPTGPITPCTITKLLQSDIPCLKERQSVSHQDLKEQAIKLHLMPCKDGDTLLAGSPRQQGSSRAAVMVAGLPLLPPLERSLLEPLQHFRHINTQPIWEPLNDDTLTPEPIRGLDAPQLESPAWSVEGVRASAPSSDRTGIKEAFGLQRKRWRAEAAAAMQPTSLDFNWAGRRDVVNGEVLAHRSEVLFTSVDGFCTSTQFEAKSGGNQLALAWLGANPVTGTPWKRQHKASYSNFDRET